jgi:hypothetical protein
MQVIGVESGKVGLVLTLAEVQAIASCIGRTNQKDCHKNVLLRADRYGLPLFEDAETDEHSNYTLFKGLLGVLSDHNKANRP